jgi:malate dehydrogenase (oxaloacetate-decarboxylating)(NADP+)
MFMHPVIDIAIRDRERLVFAEGENKTVLRTVQAIANEGIAEPIVIGREQVVSKRLYQLGIDMEPHRDFELVDPQNDPRYREYWQFYHAAMGRRGVSVDAAKTIIRTNNTAIATVMVAKNDADALICGTEGRFDSHLQQIIDVIGTKEKGTRLSSVSVLLLTDGPIFITDAFIEFDPTAEQIAHTAIASAKRVSDFGIKPKIALLSHSNFGTSRASTAIKMREATKILKRVAPDLEVDGEMHADAALSEQIRSGLNTSTTLDGSANLLVMPNLDSANIALELVRSVNDVLMIGPLLSGTAKSAHVATPSTTVKGLFNMSAIAVADAWRHKNEQGQSQLLDLA